MRGKDVQAPIFFHFLEDGFSLQDRSSLKQFIAQTFKQNRKKLTSLHYIFCSDQYLLKINREHLKHDYYTDIITFDFEERAGIKAEIYISAERVKDNAKQLGVSFKEEIHRVIFHGTLHLCGFNDKTDRERKVMREKENLLLRQYL